MNDVGVNSATSHPDLVRCRECGVLHVALMANGVDFVS